MSAWRQLVDQLIGITCGAAELVLHQEQPWATVTFSGTRHTIELSFTGSNAIAFGEAFADLFPRCELAEIAGQLVADAALVSRLYSDGLLPQLRVTVEVLLLDAAEPALAWLDEAA